MHRFPCLMIGFLCLTPIISSKDPIWRLKSYVNCDDKVYESSERISRNYWVLENYIMADHGPLSCYANVTYTTHADYRYLNNVVPLLKRWRSPLSLAIYAPGEDFDPTLRSILYLLQCHPGRHLVRELTSFHLYFNVAHMPKVVPTAKVALSRRVNCSAPAPYANVGKKDLYRSRIRIHYPVNRGRNIARDASLTYFVLASDIELYPSVGLVPAYLRFLGREVIVRPEIFYTGPVVHALRIFEVTEDSPIPETKLQLQEMINYGKAVPFHLTICEPCHRGPKLTEWMSDTVEHPKRISVFNVGQRIPPNDLWEPIFIGTIRDPPYDERLSWEGRRDKMTQAYAMCVFNYTFHILDNAFLVHRPGIKQLQVAKLMNYHTKITDEFIKNKITRELKSIYGSRRGCFVT